MVETNFKHTEIGLIPHDWEVKTLGEISTLINGRAFCQAELLNNGKYKVLRVGNFFSNDSWYYSDLELDEKLYCEIGDLLYAWSCTYGAYIWKEPKTIFHYHIWKVLPEDVEKKFLFYVLNNDTEKQKKTSQGSTMSHITKGFMENRKFALPPTLAEQERIAGALSSIDTLIGALNEQIEKKRHIKQGTMQQLLTGKKRLAGFTGEWKSVRLGEICEFSKGKGLKKEYLTNSGRYKCILYGEIFTIYDGIIKSVVSRTDVYEGTPSKKGDILMPGSTTTIGIDLVKAVALNEDNILLGGDVIILRLKGESTCADFLAYLISNVNRNKVADVTQGITIIHLHAKNMVDIAYYLPPTIAEQSAIAAVLSGMDTEIAALEQKRDKYIAIKQGMMQDLLTGKIRLV